MGGTRSMKCFRGAIQENIGCFFTEASKDSNILCKMLLRTKKIEVSTFCPSDYKVKYPTHDRKNV